MDSKNQALINNLKQTKQDKLVSGENIKTINGQSLLGHGNIEVGGGGGEGTVKSVNNVSPDAQGNVHITAENIDGFAPVATSGSYNDLSDKPTIPVDTNQKIKADGTSFGADDEINLIGDGIISITPNTDDKTITISASAPSAIVDYEDDLPEVTTDNKDSLARLDGDEVYAAEYREQQGEQVELLVQSTTSNQPSKALAQEWWDINQTYVTINTINNVKGFFHNTPEGEKPNCPFNIGSNKNIGYITFTIKDTVTTPVTLLARAYVVNGVAKQSSIKVTDPHGNETDYTLSTELNENNFTIVTEITLSSIGQYTITGIPTTDESAFTNNMFLLSGIRFGSSAQIVKNWHQLARKEYVDDNIAEVNERLDDVEEYFETEITNVAAEIDAVDQDLQETKETIGDVQIWNAAVLPQPSAEYVNKILRVNNVLYQCFRNPNALVRRYSFENCTGTNQINANNFADFQRLVTDNFFKDFSLTTEGYQFYYAPFDGTLEVGHKYRLSKEDYDYETEWAVYDDALMPCVIILSSNGKILEENSVEYIEGPIYDIDWINISREYLNADDIANNIYIAVPQLDFKVLVSAETPQLPNNGVSERQLEETTNFINIVARDNGRIKFGNSANPGFFSITKNEDSEINLPLTSITFNAISYYSGENSSDSCIRLEFISKYGDETKSYSIRKNIPASLDVQSITINQDDEGNPLSLDLDNYNIVIGSDNVGFINFEEEEQYADRRIYLASMQFNFGQGDEFLWEICGSPFMKKVTWQELKDLRDNESLIPGMQYRITDYHCTTSQFDTQSADHQFDIIVTADSKSILNENARACKHDNEGSGDDDSLIIQNGKFTCIPDNSMIKYAQFIDTEEFLEDTGKNWSATENSFDSIGYLDDGTPVVYINSNEYKGVIDDFTDYWKYVGIYNYNGVDYDRWVHCNHGYGEEHLDNETSGQPGRYLLTRKNEGSSDYFANAKLEAWQLKYCLDNDEKRFAWACSFVKTKAIKTLEGSPSQTYIHVRYPAGDRSSNEFKIAWAYVNATDGLDINDPSIDWNDIDSEDLQYTKTENPEVGEVTEYRFSPDIVLDVDKSGDIGKGVIYYMKDEWNNECPYDFKNIMFKRYKVVDITNDNILSDLEGKYVGYIGDMNGLEIEDEEDFIWCYTFHIDNEAEGLANTDASLNIAKYTDPDGGGYSGGDGSVRDNIIKANIVDLTVEEKTQHACYNLNNIVMFSQCYMKGSNVIELKGSSNIQFDTKCCDISIIRGSGSRFNQKCYNMVFGDCGLNIFNSNCYSNTFGYGCHGNTFGCGCSWNTFGSYCFYNTFGKECVDNIFGENCYYNTFGDWCMVNTFGNECCYNTFGKGCGYNILLGTGQSGAWYNIFEDNIENVHLNGLESSNYYLQNIRICSGIQGTNMDPKVITEQRGLDHSVTYKAAGSEEKTI